MESVKKPKKELKNKDDKSVAASTPVVGGPILSKSDLKVFLLNVSDRLADGTGPIIHVTSAMNHVLNLEGIYEFLDNENKELARDIWLRVKKAGVHMHSPPMLFGPEEDGLANNQ